MTYWIWEWERNTPSLWCLVAKSFLFFNPKDCSPPDSSVMGFSRQGIFLTQGLNSHRVVVGGFFTAEPSCSTYSCCVDLRGRPDVQLRRSKDYPILEVTGWDTDGNLCFHPQSVSLGVLREAEVTGFFSCLSKYILSLVILTNKDFLCLPCEWLLLSKKDTTKAQW